MVFCGSGATHAIAKLIGVLGLKIPSALDDRYHLTDAIPADERPVVFIGPYEHHSNELPWRESIADVVTIPGTRQDVAEAALRMSAAEARRPSEQGARP